MDTTGLLRLPLISRSQRNLSSTAATTPMRSPWLSPAHSPAQSPSNHAAQLEKKLGKYLKKKTNVRSGSIDITCTHEEPNKRLNFFSSYKNLPKLSQRNQFNHIESNSNVAYLEEIDKVRLNPKPFGMIQKEGLETTIDIHMYSMGDKYAEAFSTGLDKLKHLEALNLKGNGLSQKGATKIITNLASKKVKNLNLADNKIGEQSIEKLIEIISNHQSVLKCLNLENTKLTDKPVIMLCQCLTENKVLTKLVLAKNHITDLSAKNIAEMLSYNNWIRFLDLHWNKIRGPGAKEIFEGIENNDGLKHLDLSWNAMGNNQDLEISQKVGAALKKNRILMHLDLSYNYFNMKECEIIGNDLKYNHTLLGIHMLGNSCKVTSRGFIVPIEGQSGIERAHFFQRAIGASPRASEHPEENLNCWICERWVEMTFKWTPGVSGDADTDPIFLNLECDEYEQDYMVKNEKGIFISVRAVPHGKINFFFSTLKEHMLSREIDPHALDEPMEISIGKNKLEISVVNTKNAEGIEMDPKNPFDTLPRMHSKYQRPRAELERIPWSVPISLFKDYKFDTDELMLDGFEFDYKHTRINNFVKKPEEQELVKAMLRKVYRNFRESYKYISAIGGNDVFCIGSNLLTDFLNQCNMFDEYFSISDLGVNWNSTNSQPDKNQIYNAGNGLCRYEFMEVLVRIANDKYVRNKLVDNVADAVKRMMEDHIFPIFAQYDSNKWRFERYVCEDVDLCLKCHRLILDTLYKRYSGKKTLPGKKPFMCLDEFRSLCTDARLISDTFATREIDICYSQSMMTQIDELYKSRHMEMSFVEFIEAICRAADLSNLPKITGEVQENIKDLPLKAKLENTFPYLLKICPFSVRDSFIFPTEDTYFNLMYRPKVED